MVNALARADSPRMLKQFADWTDRVAAGELPGSRPPRPQGVERNVVLTLWDWSNAKAYLHDEVVADVLLFHMVSFARVGDKIEFTPTIATNSMIELADISFK